MSDVISDVTNNITNTAKIVGYVVSSPEIHHSTHGEDFYEFSVRVPILNSSASDIIRVEISDRVYDVSKIDKDAIVSIEGQFRSFNEHNSETGKISLRLFLFTRDIEILDSVEEFTNKITLRGFICKDVVHRRTPGGREISDVILSVNRLYSKSDYIPCVVWGRNSKYVYKMDVGTEVEFVGRIQSRVYTKKFNDGSTLEREVYEVSVSDVTKISD